MRAKCKLVSQLGKVIHLPMKLCGYIQIHIVKYNIHIVKLGEYMHT